MTVYMCGEYQNRIRRMIAERAQRSGDQGLARFVESVNKTQRIEIGHIRKDVLGKFNDGCLSYFDDNTDDLTRDRYSSIVSNRNSAAHGGDITMTLGELKTFHQSAKRVLDVLGDALDRSV